jgi:hypothetical protein
LASFDSLEFCSGALLEKDQITLFFEDGIAPSITAAQLLLEVSPQFLRAPTGS